MRVKYLWCKMNCAMTSGLLPYTRQKGGALLSSMEGNLFPMTSNKQERFSNYSRLTSDPNIKQPRTFLLLVTLMTMPFLNIRHVTQTYYIQTMYIFRKQAWTITGKHFDVHGICEIDTHKTCEDNAETGCNHQNARGCIYII